VPSKHVTEGATEGTVRRGSRRKQLQDDLKETRSYYIALCRELALQEAMNLSQDRPRNE
jgi:hypothetical protein